MDDWKRLSGTARVRLTSADCGGRLRMLSKGLELEDVTFPSPVEAEFTIWRRDLSLLRTADGERIEILSQTGPERLWNWAKHWWLTIVTVLLLALLTAYLPGRILFIRVEGNGDIPQRLILEAAEGCALEFGASRRELRSEQVKNHLLHEIPQLRWAGVNTQGCVATITVSPRSESEEWTEVLPGDLVAVRDAVVTRVYPAAGTGLIQPGASVRAGQVLISGFTDLGLCTRADRAEGEVYGLTRRHISVRTADSVLERGEVGKPVRKISLLIGKKRINFTSDSGILDGTCVKMRTVNYLTLPGGFQLPAAVITEIWYPAEMIRVPRADAQALLLDAARRYVLGDMIAGEIVAEDASPEGNTLEADFSCREMIARFRAGVQFEGDTNDRENGERGAG